MSKVTKAQAAAFINTLIGWESVGDEQSKPVSPAVKTHLEAVLGLGNLPSENTIYYISRGHSFNLRRSDDNEEKSKYDALLNYLQSVVEALQEEITNAD